MAKITEVRLHTVAPLGEREIMPGSTVSWLFIEISTDEGLTGIGECSNWPRRGNAIVGAALRAVADELVGRDPDRIELIWNEIFRRYTYLGNRGVITAAISGIDMALWDLKGKRLGRPIHDLLGGAVREAIPLYTHPVGTGAAALVEDALALHAAGFGAFKFDPFAETAPRHTDYRNGYISKAGVRAGAQLIEAVRAAVGPDLEILIDFHGHYNVESALRCIRALQPHDITWFEEPFPPEGLSALRQLRAQTDAPLCVGERLHTRWDFQSILAEGLVNFVMPDVCWTGGISELRKIASLAEAHFVPIAPHGALGPLQAIAGGHVMAVSPNCYRLEILGAFWQQLYGSWLEPGLDIREGQLYLSDRPGLGVELNHDLLRHHATAAG
jgi:galactonate dehydratase